MGFFSLSVKIDTDLFQNRYNHLHHAQTLTLLEKGRIALLESINQPIDTLMESGLALVITRIDVIYKRELRSETVTVTCDSGIIEDRTICVTQRIINEKGKEAVRATVWSAFMSTETRRGLDVPESFGRALGEWQAGGERLP